MNCLQKHFPRIVPTPRQRRTQVVVLRAQPVEPDSLARPAQFEFTLLSQRHEPCSMPRPHLGLFSRFCQPITITRHIEKALRDWGVVIIHKRNMHEKLVFIDDHTLWSGSLNPLSYTDTQEVMERRFSPKVVSDYSETLKLDDLLRAFDAGETDCPICGGEIIASGGRKEPCYWRCVEDGCFSRSIGQPMPTDGRITCANCGAPVEFGEWGKRFAWRCTFNPRHRQPIVRSHLKLPKMQELVPPKQLKKLQKSLGIIGQQVELRLTI